MDYVADTHDRLIVATALYFNASLITRDERISQTGTVITVW